MKETAIIERKMKEEGGKQRKEGSVRGLRDKKKKREITVRLIMLFLRLNGLSNASNLHIQYLH